MGVSGSRKEASLVVFVNPNKGQNTFLVNSTEFLFCLNKYDLKFSTMFSVSVVTMMLSFKNIIHFPAYVLL